MTADRPNTAGAPRHPYEIANERLRMHLNGLVATGRIQAIAEAVVDAMGEWLVDPEAAQAQGAAPHGPFNDWDGVDVCSRCGWRSDEAPHPCVGAAPSAPQALDVERALASHQAAMDDQRKKYHCGPTTCSHDLAHRLAPSEPTETGETP